MILNVERLNLTHEGEPVVEFDTDVRNQLAIDHCVGDLAEATLP